jgi:hypothetical protein
MDASQSRKATRPERTGTGPWHPRTAGVQRVHVLGNEIDIPTVYNTHTIRRR